MSNPAKFLNQSGYGIAFVENGINYGREDPILRQYDLSVLAFGYQEHMEAWNFREVFSPFWRFYYNDHAGKHIIWNRKRYTLKQGQALIIPSHTVFDTKSQKTTDHLWIHFELSTCFRSCMHEPMALPLDKAQKALIESLQKTPNNPHTTEQTYPLCHALLYTCFHALPRPSPPALRSPEFEKLLKHMDKEATRIDSIQTLARKHGFSERTLRRRFEEHLGMTPHLYLTLARLRKAAEALLNTEHSLDMIADICGLGDRAAFSKSFKKHIGIAPSAYRRSTRSAS